MKIQFEKSILQQQDLGEMQLPQRVRIHCSQSNMGFNAFNMRFNALK